MGLSDDWKTLFITTFGEIDRLRVEIPGILVPLGEVERRWADGRSAILLYLRYLPTREEEEWSPW